jgi:hypothetical protein
MFQRIKFLLAGFDVGVYNEQELSSILEDSLPQDIEWVFRLDEPMNDVDDFHKCMKEYSCRLQ